MSRAIWKFTLDPGHTRAQMPKGARLLHVHEQHREVCVWAEVEPSAPIVDRVVFVVGTGHEFTVGVRAATYVGTAHVGGLVLHVYDGGEL